MTLVPGADFRPSEEMVELEKSDKGTSRPLSSGLNVQFVALGNPDLPIDKSLLEKRNYFFFPSTISRPEISMKLIALAILASFSAALVQTATAQKLVDPDKVAPEFREAAIKRRAEQVQMMDCNRKAVEAKVLPRDRAAHVQHCLEGQQDPR
jgi:hypothetical protein